MTLIFNDSTQQQGDSIALCIEFEYGTKVCFQEIEYICKVLEFPKLKHSLYNLRVVQILEL